MSRPSSPVALWSQYLGARLAEMCLAIGGADAALGLAPALGRLLFRFDRTHRQRALAHLAIAFPDLGAEQIHQLALRSFEHFARLIVELCYCPRMFNRASWTWHVSVGPVAEAVALLNSGTPAVMLTGHLGNWEILGNAMALLGYPMHAVARPIDNPLLNEWLLGIRQKHGMRILAKTDAADEMVRLLQAGGVLGFIADQSAGERGTFVPFFNRLASAHKSIALLALTQNVPVICGYARRRETGFGFELGVVDVIRPEHWADAHDPVYYITARYVHAIETMVRRAPQQYLWMHRRWRRRPLWEHAGKPMPPRLRRNLEELPWVDSAAMTQLTRPPDDPKTPARNR